MFFLMNMHGCSHVGPWALECWKHSLEEKTGRDDRGVSGLVCSSNATPRAWGTCGFPLLHFVHSVVHLTAVWWWGWKGFIRLFLWGWYVWCCREGHASVCMVTYIVMTIFPNKFGNDEKCWIELHWDENPLLFFRSDISWLSCTLVSQHWAGRTITLY